MHGQQKEQAVYTLPQSVRSSTDATQRHFPYEEYVYETKNQPQSRHSAPADCTQQSLQLQQRWFIRC